MLPLWIPSQSRGRRKDNLATELINPPRYSIGQDAVSDISEAILASLEVVPPIRVSREPSCRGAQLFELAIESFRRNRHVGAQLLSE